MEELMRFPGEDEDSGVWLLPSTVYQVYNNPSRQGFCFVCTRDTKESKATYHTVRGREDVIAHQIEVAKQKTAIDALGVED